MPAADHRDFPWDESDFVLEELEAELGPGHVRDGGRAIGFADSDVVMHLPLVQTDVARELEGESVAESLRAAGRADERDLDALRARLSAPLAWQCVVLVRAGAFSFGLWEDDELVQHKSHKRYVTRGKGKAQSTHLKTRGKSRYGSRLRLQNQKAQLEDLGSRLGEVAKAHDELEQLWLACPKRLLADLYACKVPPPFPRDAWRRIPMHVHEPTFEELLRVRAELVTGHIRSQGGQTTSSHAGGPTPV